MSLTNRFPAPVRPTPARRAQALLLGGTHEARVLAERIAATPQIEGVVSLAGRTSAPLSQALPVRVGGFGGAAGLADYMTRYGVTHVIDATHPFAVQISINAREACVQTGAPLLRLTRAPWSPVEGDEWISVMNNADAIGALGVNPRRVFLTIGRQGVAAFRVAPQHRYLLRVIDPPEVSDLPPDCTVIADRGPFTSENERALMLKHKIEVLVSKNSGGALTLAKIEAARVLGIPVVMISRPVVNGVRVTHDLDDALAFLGS